MNEKNNVSLGKPKIGGAIFSAPVGTVLPTDAISELGETFKPLGFINEDGVGNETSVESETLAWGGESVLQVKQDTFKFVFIEATNIDVLKTVYGDSNVTGDVETGIVIKVNDELQEKSSLVIDMVLKGGILKRIVIPNAQVSEVGEIVYGNEDPIGYETTLKALDDENDNKHYEYIKKKVVSPTP